MSHAPAGNGQPPDVPSARRLGELVPVAPSERIHGLDLLRGWAMFGVLWSNLNDWYGYRQPVTALDRGLSWVQDNLIEGRFYTLLCLLFGIGFGIQLVRATSRGVDVRNTYYRRCLALLAIGAVHAFLIWSHDILMLYALVAFALVMFRTASPRRILMAAMTCWFVVPEVLKRARYVAGMRFLMPSVDNWATQAILANGSWRQIAPLRVAMKLEWLGRFGLGMYFSILALFLVGLWVVRSGYLRRVIEDPGTTRRLLLGAIAAAAVGFVWMANVRTIYPLLVLKNAGPGTLRFWIPTQWIWSLFSWSTEGMAVAYAAILLLLWQRPRIARLLRPLAATGRMALTTYLTQSVVCTLLFYGYGLGWYGRASFTDKAAITLALFSCQMVVSTWWLSRFRYGPVEWLWRAITYGRAPVQLRSVVLLAAVSVPSSLFAQGAPGETPSRAKIIAAAREIMQAAHYCTLVTLGADGQPQARIVDPFPPDSDLTIWIGTNPLTRKVDEIRRDPRVTLMYFSAATFEYVTVIGTAVPDTGAMAKAGHWKESWASLYKDQNRGDDYLLLRVKPSRMEVVSVRRGINNEPKTWRPVSVDIRP